MGATTRLREHYFPGFEAGIMHGMSLQEARKSQQRT